MVNRRIEEAFEKNGNFTGAIMHGYTYAGHPVACAAALACLDIVVKEDLPANAAKMGDYLLAKLQPFVERFDSVGEVRGQGLMVALDLVADKSTREPIDPTSGYANQVAQIAREHGVMVRPVGTKIILSPPLVIQPAQVDVIVDALAQGLSQARR